MAKPSSKIDWTVGNPTARTEPTAPKKDLGWVQDERPAKDFMNWLFYNIWEWLEYFEDTTDGLILQDQYDAVIGAGAGCTHATLAAALADVALTTGVRVLVKDDYTVNSTIQFTKNNWRVTFAPGVTYTKGTAVTGLQIAADGIEIMHGRFAGFSVGGDIAVQFQAAGLYGKVLYSRFYNCDTEVDDSAVPAGKKPVTLGTITEV